MLVVKRTPFAVDGHEHVRGQVQVSELGNGAAVLHVGGVATGAEDATNLHLGVGIGRCNESSGGVVDQS